MSNYELPVTRLGTTDEAGRRIYIHTQDVTGRWTNVRNRIYWLLIMLYLVLPWIYIGGKQIIRLDLPTREFYIFGTMFYGHDGPMLVYLLLGFLFFISYITSVLGRVWCGYACPQTIFIEALYRPIEKFIEGSARKRDRLEQAPWGLRKIRIRASKWFLYFLISFLIAHSGVAYFVGSRELIEIIFQSPSDHWSLFLTLFFVTGVILLDFGWFREQFCIIACPYGRFQSLVMDANSLIVSYDNQRGEPRKRTKGVELDDIGDCVNCGRCVKVCPTGIDIRDGLQMECLACTMCIDACDEIMLKVGKPQGLIKYTTEIEINGGKRKIGRRSYTYLFLLIVAAGGLVYHLQLRKRLKTQFLRAGKVAFQVVGKHSGTTFIANHFKLKFNDYGDHELKQVYDVRLSKGQELPKLSIISPDLPVELNEDNFEANIFFQFPKEYLLLGQKIIFLEVYSTLTNKVIKNLEVKLAGPIK